MRSGASGTIGPIERFGRPGQHVHDRVREEEVELAALDLARRVVGAARLGPRRADLGHAPAVGLEQVRVRRDVDDRREAGVRDRAVVALEEVLRADLPVRVRARTRRVRGSGGRRRRCRRPRSARAGRRGSRRAAARRGRGSRRRTGPRSRAGAGRGRARRSRRRPRARRAARRRAGRRGRTSRRGTGTGASTSSRGRRRRSSRGGGRR